MKRVLFVNHRVKECGVEQLGSRYYRNFKESQRYDVEYVDVDRYDEYAYWYDQLKPAAVIWNMYSGATMPWCSREVIDEHRSESKQLVSFTSLI